MELTLTKALQKGIEAHKAGKVQEADRYYTAILKTNPKHPDANHNMGILAVGVGKAEEALPFFKTALEANSSITQYWLSYIAALIKLDRIADAKAVFDQAKNNGAKGDGFDQIEKQLRLSPSENANIQEPSQERLQILANLYSQGQYQEALIQASQLLEQFPNSINLYNILGALNKGLGKLDEAIKAYKEILSIKPDYAEAYSNMGVTLKEQGKLDKAIKAYKKAISIKPDFAQAYYNMGNALQEQGKLDEAIKAYNKTISIKPDHAQAYYNTGNTLKELGKLEEAIEAYNQALTIKPDHAEAYYNMGNALKEIGKLGEAIEAYNRAFSTEPDHAEAYYNTGVILQELGKLKEAIEAYTKAFSIKPDHAQAYYNTGVILQELGKLKEAIETYNQALAIKPDHAEAHNNKGNALTDQGKLEEAIEAYTKALSTKPDFAGAYNNKGNALQELGQLEEAIEAYKQALSIKPDFAEAWNNIGVTLKDQGKLEEAIEAFTKVLSIKPDYAGAHHNLSSIRQYTSEDEHFFQVKDQYRKGNLQEDARCTLSFALAKIYEDIGELDQAFSHLSEGNALRKKLLKYSINEDKDTFIKLKKTQPNLQKSSLKIEQGSSEVLPVFILGMPRSGTTLVEQIISSHSMVTGAGELNYVAQYGGKLAINSASKYTVPEFRKKYLLELSKVSNGKYLVVDKMPLNFRFIPLICTAFPEAKIIHIQRNAAATCWSNYKQYFSSKGLGYSYDLHDIISYFRLYTDLMDLWQSIYCDRIYNLGYEKLTIDQKNETRKLIKHLELDWEENCLSPHKNNRSVRTASQQQVRQKVYTGSSENWRKYEAFLNGVFDGLPS